ncbi:hypothetical protein [Deinococcus arcticus]|uniref:Uncharacterized protein n=1 Tax=Deinococcus arcticus TaxID=2136176 RepID=A0A2T3WBX4_9DEIO|nr:hypothetical protein [Deinococcus arcticus]PTA69400.1 hypothetical protein C8263_03515 [Deinococcus arcticus]
MGQKGEWTFVYPGDPARSTLGEVVVGRPLHWSWLGRLRFALSVLRRPASFPPNPQRMKRVGDVPAGLSGVAWPPSVNPLGLYRAGWGGEEAVLLELPADETARGLAHRATMAALAAALPPLRLGGVGFAPWAQAFRAEADRALLPDALWPHGPHPLRWVPYPDPEVPGTLWLSPPPGQRWSGDPGSVLLLLAPGSDLRAAFAHWLAQAAEQGWSAQPPLFGARQALTTLDQPGRRATLSASLFTLPWGECWAVTLDRGWLDTLAGQAHEPGAPEPRWQEG